MAIILDTHNKPGLVVSLDTPDSEAEELADKYALANSVPRESVLIIKRDGVRRPDKEKH